MFSNPVHLQENICNHHQETWKVLVDVYSMLRSSQREEFQTPQGDCFYLLLNFLHWTLVANINRSYYGHYLVNQSPRRFNLGLWQIPKQIYGKLQYREKVSAEFQGLPRFPRKLFFYLLLKFGIIQPWINIPSLRRFNLGF